MNGWLFMLADLVEMAFDGRGGDGGMVFDGFGRQARKVVKEVQVDGLL